MDTLNANERSLGRALGKRALVYIGILVLIFALVLILNTSNASAAGPTPVTGPIAADTNWNATGSPYYVTGSVTVNAGVTLTIWPNTTVAFAPGTSLDVAGTLHVLSNGTSVNKVVTFTSNQTGTESPGDWSGISFESGSVGSFSNARVLYAYNAIWMNNASVTFTGLTTIADTENYALTYTWATGNHTVTLNNFAITNAYVGIDIGAAPGGNAGLTLSNSDILDSVYGVYAYSNDGDLSVVLRNVGIEASYPATLSAPNGEVNLDVLDDSVMDAFGFATAISISAEDLIDINLVGLTLTDADNGVSADSNTGDIVLNAVDCWFESIPGNALQIVADEGTIAITLTNTVFNETATDYLIAAVYANAFSDLSVTTNGVQVINSSWGFALWNTNDTITLDFTDTVLNGAAMLRGIWTGSTNGNIIVNIDNLNLVMMANVLTDEGYDAIKVTANTSIEFTATDLSVNFGFDAVHLENNFEGVSASIVGFTFTNSAGDGIYIDSAADVALTVESGVLDNHAMSNQWFDVWGIDVFAMTGIEASITDVEMTALRNGVSLETENGDILATLDSVSMIAWNDTWWAFVPTNGVLINALAGSVDASLTDVSFESIINVFDGSGVQIYANNSIDLVIDGLDIANDLNGLWVESYTGDVDASITGLVVNHTDGVGASFYADDGAINLEMNNSLINDSYNAALVIQAMYDTQVVLDTVEITNSYGDGVIIFVNVEDLVLGISDTVISDIDGIGLNVVVANGQIDVTIDPSSVEFVGTGIYLDAMGAVNLSIYDSFVGFAEIGIEIHSFDGGINVLLDNVVLGYNNVYGLFADADNSDIIVTAINGTIMTENWVGWYLITSNGSVPINLDNITFEYGGTGVWVESSDELIANVVNSQFLGQEVLGMNLNSDNNITLNVVGSTFDGQIAENAQLFYPSTSEGQYIIIQPEAGNWTTNQSLIASLPFDFAFNGASWNQVTMSLNGWLAFGTDGAPDASEVYSFGSESPNLIAPAQNIWSAYDPAMDGYFHGMGYKYDGELNAVIFQWFVWNVDQPQLTNVFEVILYEGGAVEFRYAMMDGNGLSDYAFGINMYDGPNWDLSMVDGSVFYMDFQSVYFSMEMMSDGSAISAIAGKNMIATIDSSSFSHYIGGGVLLVAVDGVASINMQGSDFSYIYAITQTMGAFVAAALDNVMTADISECTFDTIGTAAIVLFDAPYLGGVDSFMVENNHFNEVMITTAIVSMIYDDANSTGSYVSTKTFADNDGTHVGIMAIATNVIANDVAWSIQETDVIENNNFTGEIDPWLLSTISGMTMPYLGGIGVEMMTGMMNDIFVFESDLGANQIAHSLSVTGNKISEGPIDEYYDLGQPEFGAVTVEETIALADEASLTIQTNISVIDNEISAWDAPLYSGVEILIAESLANPVDGLLDSTVMATFVNNTIESWFYGTGLGLYVSQDLNDGKGQGVLNVDVVATGNYVDGFGNGLVVAVETSASNLFGDVVSSVDVLVQDNEIYTYFEGVVVDLQTSDSFQHYFPPYEQVVESNATMVIDVEIIGNQVSGWDGILVDTSASATEDRYGVFTDAYASITGPVNVLDNNVNSYYEVGVGIDVESSVSAAVSMASAMSDVPVTVVNNTINSYYDATGIIIVNSASTSTMALRFYDQPTARMISTINVSANTLYGGSGIAIDQSAEAVGGESHAVVTAQIDVMDNAMSSIVGTGISVDLSGYTDSVDYYPWVNVNADVVITDNNVSCYGGTGISVKVLPNVDSDWYVYLEGSVLIENNTVSGADVGIFVSTDVPSDIMHNVLTDVVVGISASGYDIHIFENTISGVIESDGDGIYLEDVHYVTIQGNTISNVGGDGIGAVYVYDVLIMENTFENIGMSGVYLSGEEDTSYYLEVSNNNFTNIGDSGVEVNDIEGLWVNDNVMTNVSYFGVEVNNAMNVFIENNTMTGMNGGVDLYDISNANIMNNVMSASAATQDYGIDVDSADTIIATGNEMTGFANGVEFDDVNGLVYTWNVVTGSLGDGGYFYVDEAVIANSAFNDNGLTGVIIEDSYGVTFANNEVMNNGLDGLFVIETDTLTIVNGMFVDNDMYGIALLNTSVDWNVDAASSVIRNDVLFSGDLTVMEGGSLMLDTVDFAIVQDVRDGLSTINVMAGGTLSAIDTEFYATSWYSEGFSVPYGNYYEFNVYGTLEFINVYESDALELYLGAGSVVTIETSTITDNVKNGIHIVDSSPVIMSCSIVSNPRNGIFIEGGAAAPRITDCIIADNNRGIYALNTKLEAVTDNLIVLNSEAGLFADNVSGSIHDNTFLFNHKEIYVRNSNVSIQDNQIGYTPLVQLLVQFVPLLQGFNLSTDIFLPELGLSISSLTVQNIMIGHVGIYAINSVVKTSGNTFGMLGTAVQVVNSDLTFGDDIRQNTIIVPYMDNGGIIRNMSLPIPVWDGIVATNSHVVIRGASIDVLDDAVFLDNSTATISSSSLKGGDFNLYLINGSHATVTDSTFGKAGAEDVSAIDVWEKLTVVVKDPWGTALANVPVKVGTLESTTDSDGTTVVYVEAYVLTSSGKAPAQPNLVTANFTTVPTTAYPGHASWSPLVLSKTVSVSGPTTVVLVPSVIVRYDLTVHALNKDNKNAVNVTVVVRDASGNPVQAQSNATGVATFQPIGWIKNADGTTDNSMTPYAITAEIDGKTAKASTDLTGNTNLDLMVDYGPQFDYGPAIIIAVFVVILVAILLLVTRRKP